MNDNKKALRFSAGGIAFIRAKEGWGGVHTENHA